MIQCLSVDDLIIRVLIHVLQRVDAGHAAHCFRPLLNVMWRDGWITVSCDRIVAYRGEWVGECAWILIIGFFLFTEGCCRFTIFKIFWRMGFHVLKRVNNHIHTEHDGCELCELEEERAPVANVREADRLIVERTV